MPLSASAYQNTHRAAILEYKSVCTAAEISQSGEGGHREISQYVKYFTFIKNAPNKWTVDERREVSLFVCPTSVCQHWEGTVILSVESEALILTLKCRSCPRC